MKKELGARTGVGLVVGAAFCLTALGQGGQGKVARDGILRIAAAIAKGETASATMHVEALAQKIAAIDDVMNLMRPRNKKGLGVGEKPGAIIPDGIELKLLLMARAAPPQNAANSEAAALEKMAHVLAAVAEVAMAKAPKAKAREWTAYAKELRAAAPQLASAARAKNPAQLQEAAAMIFKACNNCHSVFK